MDKQTSTSFRWNAGAGMAAGTLIGAFVALLVSSLTGDQSIWSWAIPAGLASGLAVGAGRERTSKGA